MSVYLVLFLAIIIQKKQGLSFVIPSWKNLFNTKATSVISVLVDTYKTFDYFQPQKR